MINSLKTFIILTVVFLLGSCTSSSQNGLKVAASAVPHSEMLEYIRPDLKAQGIDLVIIVTDDYNVPNRALANGEVDANFFQHLPFMDAQIEEFHFPIQTLAKVEVEPMGIYSKKLTSLSNLKDGATIAIPNDPTNEGRALLLLQKESLIQLDSTKNLKATPLNIVKNPKQLKFIEVDAAMLPRTLEDVDAAAINTNYALSGGLNPQQALALENQDSPYVNIIAIRTGEENREDLQALKKAMNSEKMKEYIINKYKGAIIPTFN